MGEEHAHRVESYVIWYVCGSYSELASCQLRRILCLVLESTYETSVEFDPNLDPLCSPRYIWHRFLGDIFLFKISKQAEVLTSKL